MRPIGFSTGAVAYSDFRAALQILELSSATAVELSALRVAELDPLMEALGTLNLDKYSHVSVHLPSSAHSYSERDLVKTVGHFPEDWLLITHPDVIQEWNLWESLGRRICIENMDKRKPIGQTARDLYYIFKQLPKATFCFDIGHAHQVDPTMGEAVLILEEFRERLRQLHISEVNSESKHDLISLEAERSFRVLAQLIPEDTTAILESRVTEPGEALGPVVKQRIEHELRLVENVLSGPTVMAAD